MLREYIVELQKNMGDLSERELAKRFGKSHEWINSLKNGDYMPRVETVLEVKADAIHMLNFINRLEKLVMPDMPEVVEETS